MDSGNEVLIVDDNIAAANGLNGHSDDLKEMKTRSKATKNMSGNQDKAGSDTEKKDKKINNKEVPNVKVTLMDMKTVGSATKKGTKLVDEVPSKKKVVDREDDSGINSRASSVSNDDVPRMRTRSSRTSEIASTSTPAKKEQGRVPLSSYDFDDVTFDEDISSPNPLKRKATIVYVEEMDEADEEEGSSEPNAKRITLVPSTNVLGAIFYPFKVLHEKLYFGKKIEPKADIEKTVIDVQIVTETDVQMINENVEQIVTTTECTGESANNANTCTLM